MSSRACIGKQLSDNFIIQKCLEQGDALTSLLFSFAVEGPGKRNRTEIKCDCI
jgi:hypothetical protein